MLAYLINEMRGQDTSFKVIFFGENYLGFQLKSEEIVRIERTNRWFYIKVFINLLKSSDRIIWGGGTCFTDEEGDGFFIGMLIAKLFGVKIEYRSIGVGNLRRFSRKVKFFILMYLSDKISFREENSLSKFKSFFSDKKVTLEEDLGEKYLKTISCDTSVTGKGVLLAWRDLSNYGLGFESQTDLLSYLKDFLISQGVDSLTILDVDNEVDYELNNFLEQELKSGFLVDRQSNLNFNEKIQVILSAELIITARLHILLSAILFQKNVKVYSYSPKINFVISEQMENVETFIPYS